MAQKPITISMTRFADFVVTDPLGQMAKVREVRRQYEQPYKPGSDFWSRWREDVEKLHRKGATRDGLPPIGKHAKDNRVEQYTSACEGYAKFWGRKHLAVVGHPKPALWTHGHLQVRVNPEWILEIDGKQCVVKLHLAERLVLNQRLANPLLGLLDMHFGSTVGGPDVAILDVHRGRLLRPTTSLEGMSTVLHMQAAAFLAGWADLDPPVTAA